MKNAEELMKEGPLAAKRDILEYFQNAVEDRFEPGSPEQKEAQKYVAALTALSFPDTPPELFKQSCETMKTFGEFLNSSFDGEKTVYQKFLRFYKLDGWDALDEGLKSITDYMGIELNFSDMRNRKPGEMHPKPDAVIKQQGPLYNRNGITKVMFDFAENEPDSDFKKQVEKFGAAMTQLRDENLDDKTRREAIRTLQTLPRFLNHYHSDGRNNYQYMLSRFQDDHSKELFNKGLTYVSDYVGLDLDLRMLRYTNEFSETFVRPPVAKSVEQILDQPPFVDNTNLYLSMMDAAGQMGGYAQEQFEKFSDSFFTLVDGNAAPEARRKAVENMMRFHDYLTTEYKDGDTVYQGMHKILSAQTVPGRDDLKQSEPFATGIKMLMEYFGFDTELRKLLNGLSHQPYNEAYYEAQADYLKRWAAAQKQDIERHNEERRQDDIAWETKIKQQEEAAKQKEAQQNEPPQQEEIKQEEPPKEEIKQEEPPKEEVKQEEPPKEEVKQEEPPKEEIKQEEPQKEEAKEKAQEDDINEEDDLEDDLFEDVKIKQDGQSQTFNDESAIYSTLGILHDDLRETDPAAADILKKYYDAFEVILIRSKASEEFNQAAETLQDFGELMTGSFDGKTPVWKLLDEYAPLGVDSCIVEVSEYLKLNLDVDKIKAAPIHEIEGVAPLRAHYRAEEEKRQAEIARQKEEARRKQLEQEKKKAEEQAIREEKRRREEEIRQQEQQKREEELAEKKRLKEWHEEYQRAMAEKNQREKLRKDKIYDAVKRDEAALEQKGFDDPDTQFTYNMADAQYDMEGNLVPELAAKFKEIMDVKPYDTKNFSKKVKEYWQVLEKHYESGAEKPENVSTFINYDYELKKLVRHVNSIKNEQDILEMNQRWKEMEDEVLWSSGQNKFNEDRKKHLISKAEPLAEPLMAKGAMKQNEMDALFAMTSEIARNTKLIRNESQANELNEVFRTLSDPKSYTDKEAMQKAVGLVTNIEHYLQEPFDSTQTNYQYLKKRAQENPVLNNLEKQLQAVCRHTGAKDKAAHNNGAELVRELARNANAIKGEQKAAAKNNNKKKGNIEINNDNNIII